MILKFHPVKEKLPDMYDVMGMQISNNVPVLLQDGTRTYGALWGNQWRVYPGTINHSVVEWGEVIG